MIVLFSERHNLSLLFPLNVRIKKVRLTLEVAIIDTVMKIIPIESL